jgi:hypothetical protein
MLEPLREIEAALAEVPILDVHTHLVGDRLSARGLHDVLLYHMVVTELYSAGCPSGTRLTQYPGWPTTAESHSRIQEALPFLPGIRNTSLSWLLRVILRDLYGWDQSVTAENWRRLDDTIRERADDRAWQREVLARCRVERNMTELARRGSGRDDDQLQYSLEWAMFNRCQWGEFDTALYELERSWGREPESPTPIGGIRPPAERTIRTLADVHEAMDHYIGVLPYDRILSTAVTFSSDISYDNVGDADMERALANRGHATAAERDVYASYINELLLTGLESHGDSIVYQFALGAEPLPYETGSRINQRTCGQLGEIVARHPNLRFQCMLASRHANQSLCTLARELPNLSLAGYWWHNFFPDVIRQVMSERLDMLPLSRQVGFFSDAYCVEWVYGKSVLVRRMLAEVLAERVERGQYTAAGAAGIAREICYEAPRALVGMRPSAGGQAARHGEGRANREEGR